jgi:UDP-sulfoquinovose synthase
MKKQKVMIAGICGFIGNPLYRHLKENGFEVVGFDNHSRAENVEAIGSKSIVEPEDPPHEKLDACDYVELRNFIAKEKPDAIVWLAEQPSAPFSMMSAEEAGRTQSNNIVGTLNALWAIREVAPEAHLIKLGTEGEYPDWLWNGKHIPEGNRMIVNGDWEIPTPRYAGSWYHFSKLHDSMNIDYACKIWNIRATDVNQGVIVGHLPGTRLDIDEHFGTVANRFAAQAAIGMPLTVYGEGGQTRGFIALQNSIEAIELFIKNPAEKGQFRVIHQTAYEHSVNEIAQMVQEQTGATIDHIENPRAEMPANKFTFDTSTLENLGLRKINIREAVNQICKITRDNKESIEEVKDKIFPETKWR